MTFKNLQFISKKRRGLSSIVGALLFVVLMVATFSVLGVALNSQTDIASTSRDVAAKDLEKQQEKFTLNNIVQLPGGFLQVNMTNQGQNSAEMFTIIMTNITDTGEPTRTFEIPSDTSFLAPRNDDQTNIVRTLDLELDIPVSGSEFYNFKVISSLGTIKTLSIECKFGGLCGPSVPTVGLGALQAQLFLNGPNGVNTKTSTVVLFVQNTGSSSVYNVSPINDCDAMTTPPPAPSVSTFDPCILDSPDPFPELLPGSTAIFKWDGIVNAEIDETFVFCNGGLGFESNLITRVLDSNIPCDTLRVIDPNDCGGCGTGGDTFILIDDLLIRPSLFMIIPSPWGDPGADTDGKGVWGVNVVNPTERPMSINKVTILAYAPGGNAQDIVIPSPCNSEGISPDNVNWSCPKDNTIMWQNILAPLTIPEYSSLEFLIKLNPGSTAGNTDIDALIVQANAQTTTGSFGKAAYQSTMYTTSEEIANVYLTDLDDSRANANIKSQKLGLIELVPEEFKITIAAMDARDDTYIRSDARLIINIPREWTDVTITGDAFFVADGDPDPLVDDRIASFSDGSTQIIAVTLEDLGGAFGLSKGSGGYLPDARTLTFEATPPLNDSSGSGGIPERLYIMYVLADGQTGHVIKSPGNPDIPDPNPIGPLNEIAIQVLQP